MERGKFGRCRGVRRGFGFKCLCRPVARDFALDGLPFLCESVKLPPRVFGPCRVKADL